MTTQITDQSSNPLNQYVRHAEIYTQLPSNGHFNTSGNLELTPNKELAIAPMTTSDDLVLKSPEGLLNGDSIARVIKSCAPGIRNVYELLVPDLDVILLAIRQASYGDDMDFEIICPVCNHEGAYALSISGALMQMEFLRDEYFVKLSNDLTVYVKPFTYAHSVKETMSKYKESQAMKMLMEEDLTENVEKAAEFSQKLHTLADLMTELTAESIIKIIDPENHEMQVNKEQIFEWIKFLPRKDAVLIQKKLEEINTTGVPKVRTIICEKCEHSWESEIQFDPSTFFGTSS